MANEWVRSDKPQKAVCNFRDEVNTCVHTAQSGSWYGGGCWPQGLVNAV
jgi:hypothetical protein